MYECIKVKTSISVRYIISPARRLMTSFGMILARFLFSPEIFCCIGNRVDFISFGISLLYNVSFIPLKVYYPLRNFVFQLYERHSFFQMRCDVSFKLYRLTSAISTSYTKSTFTDQYFHQGYNYCEIVEHV